MVVVHRFLGALDSKVGGHLGVHLVQVLINVGVALLELLFGELSHLSLHHGVLVSKEAVGSSEEALKGNDLLQKAELGVGFGLVLLLLRHFDCLCESGVDLRVDLGRREGGQVGFDASFGGGLSQCLLHEGSHLLNMSLSVQLSGLSTGTKL